MPIVKQNDISMCYETFGDPNHPSIILIAGITGQLINWSKELTQGLADAGFYVICFDNRDVGLSSYFDHLETPELEATIADIKSGQPFSPPYTLSDMAHDITDLMNALNIEQAHIVGVSMGGQIAQLFAIEHAERTLSLTLVATSSGDPNLPPPKPEVLAFFFAPRSRDTDLETNIQRHVEQYKLYNHPDDFDLEAVTTEQTTAYQRAYHPAGNQRQMLAMITAAPRGEKLAQLQTPALIIHGDIDPVVPLEHGKQLAECIPNSQLKIMKNMGHGLPKRLHEELIELLAEHCQNKA